VIDPQELAEITERRDRATRAVVQSTANKRLIVAGPGTGKTYTFRQALDACEGRGLALTFIRNLVRDLEKALGDIADVFTFHGLCHHLVRKQVVAGLEAGWHYYPALPALLVKDLELLGYPRLTSFQLGRRFHQMDESEGVVREVLSLGSYYNTASHNDAVFRELEHLEADSDEIPSSPLIVVDEYQDFSLLETKVLSLLATKSPVLVAGDDDQALYDFKGASPEFIRELAAGGDFELLALPFCSRCTSVVVDAVNAVLGAAMAQGCLEERLDKEFRCFLPSKEKDSEANPSIIHAHCSIDRKGNCYPGRYIAGELAKINAEDIQESHEGNFPTALIIGPNPFLGSAYEEVAEAFPQAVLKTGLKSEFDGLHGYELLVNAPDSRLGWRIIVHSTPFDGADDVLTSALEERAELGAALPAAYREHHLGVSQLLARLIGEEELGAGEVAILEAALDRSLEEIVASLDHELPADPEPDPDQPTVLFTSFEGAKGLSACHVFMVGLVNGHFPRDRNAITDKEVCSLLVGLSRTRKRCHLISVGQALGRWQTTSCFLDWLKPHLERVEIKKDYFSA
jgi:superfamily I DNA/RNA helicase